MQVVVNGEERTVPDGATVQSLVAFLGGPESGRGIAVVMDGAVVPRSQWAVVDLYHLATFEVLMAVQGG